jgi:hypothetical protein
MVTPTTTKETIPLWLAVSITIVVALPLSLYLGRYNIPLWASFIVWAEYFTFGAKASALRIIIPCYAYGAVLTALSLYMTVLLAPHLPKNMALYISLAVWMGILVYLLRYSKFLWDGSLAVFNGVSLSLGVYFTASYPATHSIYAQPWVSFLWVLVAGYIGAFLGWFNVTITFPRIVRDKSAAAE